MAGERQLPGLGLYAFWTLGSSGWKDQNDGNLRVLSALVQASVLSFVASVPGSPTNGDRHVITSGAEENNIAVRDNGAWAYIVPGPGFLVYNIADATFWTFDGATWAELATGGSGSWLTGAAVPDPGDGEDGDLYLRSNGDVYQKTTGSWGTALFSLLGPPGTNGTNGTNGTDGADGADGTDGADFPAKTIVTKTGAYTLTDVEFAGNVVLKADSASAFTLTLNTGLVGVEPLNIVQYGAGQITVAGTATLRHAVGPKTRTQYSLIAVVPIGTDEYLIVGDAAA